MANPNLANLNYRFSRTAAVLASTNLGTNLLVNLVNSDSIFRINSLLVNNSNTTNSGNITISYFDYTANLASNIFNFSVAPQSNLISLINRNNNFYLKEGDTLKVTSNISNTISVIASYDIIQERIGNIPLEYLVVAGGGGGGGDGAGGGAGGLITGTGLNVTSGTVYTVTVGAGGIGGNNAQNGFVGSNSSLGSLICSYGGGYGGTYSQNGGSGGSGGGAGRGGSGGTGNIPSTTPSQGNNGGPGNNSLPYYGAGGGGGAGGAGASGTNGAGGTGGCGANSSITGATVTYSGGGGGSSYNGGTPGTGGSGGGGTGQSFTNPGSSGIVNTGGGGGGGGGGPSGSGLGGSGGTGGSGIVILRHPTDYRTANTTGNVTITSNVGYVIYQFNGSGSITF